MKLLEAKKNNAGGYDLLTERDSGNQVRVLTGAYTNSVEFWSRIKQLAQDVLYELDNVNEESQEETIIANI